MLSEQHLAPHLTPADLAEREQVKLSTVYHWNRTRTGPPFIRLGKHVRYRISDVIEWENARHTAAREPV